ESGWNCSCSNLTILITSALRIPLFHKPFRQPVRLADEPHPPEVRDGQPLVLVQGREVDEEGFAEQEPPRHDAVAGAGEVVVDPVVGRTPRAAVLAVGAVVAEAEELVLAE